ncbi:hypothetical protein PLICRDRAFT_334879 [Plicaturopsis crispa FD-325 SS-3]|uniref:Peptidase A1 domain-containing protein n=1 Tax=Plicaturopsis crispa FD-325 SS-3 TaxID=944288 RepID=A0A0C9SYP2_PLICR|nr:hypothetical protein PLICRDRAFT_334879 [Plicaturopsis crispa FD-325 SS-3]
MFPSKALLSLLILAVSYSSVEAKPVIARDASKISLPFAAKINATGAGTIAAADRARAKVLKEKALARQGSSKRAASFDVDNATANVGVGSPATDYTLLIDTGSSNTWIGADKSYTKTSTSKDTGGSVSVTYGSGSFSGEEYTDTVTLADGLVITGQGVGVASSASGFSGVDGILGIGPVDLTSGTVSNADTVPTVTDNLLSQGTISTEVIGIYYAPAAESDSTGTLTFGGTDSDKFTGDIVYTPVTSTYPASAYWGIDQTVTYGSTSILSSTAGIVDTGTTLILLATDAYNKYVKATGAKEDNSVGLLSISQSQYNSLSSLNFEIGGSTFSLSPNAQIWPRSLNTDIGGSADSIYLVVADLGSNSGEGLDFIDGYTFLERYYSVFDTSNSQVGFASTAFTDSESN